MSLLLSTTDPLAQFGHTMGLVFLAIGAVFLAITILLASVSRRAHRRGVRTTGTIVGYSLGRRWRARGISGMAVPDTLGASGLGSTATGQPTFPVVEFQTLDGAPVHATARNGTSPRPGKVGDPITVYYTPSRPESFWAESSHSRGVNGVVLLIVGGIGALVLFIGVSMLGG